MRKKYKKILLGFAEKLRLTLDTQAAAIFGIHNDYLEASAYYSNLAMVYVFTVIGAVPTINNVLRAKKQENISYKMGGNH